MKKFQEFQEFQKNFIYNAYNASDNSLVEIFWIINKYLDKNEKVVQAESLHEPIKTDNERIWEFSAYIEENTGDFYFKKVGHKDNYPEYFI